MQLDDIQYKIIQQKLKECGWDVYIPEPQKNALLPIPENYEIYTNQNSTLEQKLIIHNQQVSLGIFHHTKMEWNDLLDFIELKTEVVWNPPKSSLRKKKP